jgi:hypothetical protein
VKDVWFEKDPELFELNRDWFERHPSYEELFKKHRAAFDRLCADGKLYTGIKRPKGFRQLARKQCFGNSRILATEMDWRRRGWPRRPRYVEGLVIGITNCVGAIHHGWLTLDGIHAIDVTLPDASDHIYFGVMFDDAVTLSRKLCKAGYYHNQLDLDNLGRMPPQMEAAWIEAQRDRAA